jgi:hypothetical protein
MTCSLRAAFLTLVDDNCRTFSDGLLSYRTKPQRRREKSSLTVAIRVKKRGAPTGPYSQHLLAPPHPLSVIETSLKVP